MVEIDILSECQHENIVQMLEAYHWEECLWMYLEYCDGGAVDNIMVCINWLTYFQIIFGVVYTERNMLRNYFWSIVPMVYQEICFCWYLSYSLYEISLLASILHLLIW